MTTGTAVRPPFDPAAAHEGRRLRIVIVGLTITSSWGNGHATTYRALVRELARAGHDVVFLEHDVPWYAGHRDLARLDGARIELYRDAGDLADRFGPEVAAADAVVIGSFVQDGRVVGAWARRVAAGVTAFYDIDTPVTLDALAAGTCAYLDPSAIPEYDLYLSFAGGRALEILERRYGARMARPLYCSVDERRYRPLAVERRWDLGYMGTYSPDRQEGLERLLLDAARARPEGRYVVAGPQYPDDVAFPEGVERIDHVAPDDHAAFYAAQRATLNLTRAAMRRLGHAPSVRLFEAAACGVPIVGDAWPGLDAFFVPGEEIVVAHDASDVLAFGRLPDDEVADMGRRARERVLAAHTAAHRARELVEYLRVAT